MGPLLFPRLLILSFSFCSCFPLLFLLLQLGFFALKAIETSSGLYRLNKSLLAGHGIVHKVRGRPEGTELEAFHLQAGGTTGDLPGTPARSPLLPSSIFQLLGSGFKFQRERGVPDRSSSRHVPTS